MENWRLLQIACFLELSETYDFVENAFSILNEKASVGYVYVATCGVRPA